MMHMGYHTLLALMALCDSEKFVDSYAPFLLLQISTITNLATFRVTIFFTLGPSLLIFTFVLIVLYRLFLAAL